MIFSIVEKVSEQEKVQKLMVKGSNKQIAAEMTNIIIELLKRGFPEDLVFSIVAEAIKTIHE